MTHQPEVLGVTRLGDAVELELRIPEKLSCLPDHFPRLPMVPGVMQVDWAIALGRAHLPVAGAFRGIAGLKFQHPLQPRDAVTLQLSFARGELAFAYRCGTRACSAGRVLFGAAE